MMTSFQLAATAKETVPGGDIQLPDLHDLPVDGKTLAIGMALFIGYLFVQTGGLRLQSIRSWLMLPKQRLRRRAYQVAMKSLKFQPLLSARMDPDTRRRAINQHERSTVRKLERSARRWASFAEIHHPPGLAVWKASKLALEFEEAWRAEMTRPDKHGNPTHDWTFKYYVGTSTIACRWAPLTPPQVTRAYEILAPTLKWPEGTQPADVITARFPADKQEATGGR